MLLKYILRMLGITDEERDYNTVRYGYFSWHENQIKILIKDNWPTAVNTAPPENDHNEGSSTQLRYLGINRQEQNNQEHTTSVVTCERFTHIS
jgi:hypothetical protein